MPVRKVQQSANVPPVGQVAECAEMPVRWPELYHHLVDGQFDDGSKRQTSSFTVFCEDGVFKVCLSNKAEGFVAFVSGSGFYAALDALEGALTDGTLDWRRSNSKGKAR